MSDDFGDPIDDANNPFAASEQPDFAASNPNRQHDIGMLKHIKPLGICMLVQAALEVLMGGALIVIAFFLPQFMRNQPQPPGQAQMPANFESIMLVVYGAAGAGMLIVAILRVFAGLRVMQYQGRILSFVSLGSGLLSVLGGCYCLPTAIGLLIWGIVVLVNDPVKQAFGMRAAGNTKEAVNEAFGL